MNESRDRRILARAARLALRSHGEAEPNPTVGCIIADSTGHPVAEGRTARCGNAHAEIVALARAGEDARGGTAWVTLEPCNHHGRTPPCVDALIQAGISRVVIGMTDPNPVAAGGIERLRVAGIHVDLVEGMNEIRRLHDPFHHRISTGRPWLVAKWAETADGDLAAPPGVSPIISGPRSHALVHRVRGRVDAILTGIGTVLADDPRLDPRWSRARRTPHRVVVDPALDMPPNSRMFSEGEGRILIVTSESAAGDHPERLGALHARGAETILLPMGVDLRAPRRFRGLGRDLWLELLQVLGEKHEVSTVMTEAGPGVLRSLFEHGLVDAALVFTAPGRFDPRTGSSPTPRSLLHASKLESIWNGHRGADRVEWWHRGA